MSETIKEWKHGEQIISVGGQECVRIPLTKGMFAIIDKSDADEICLHKWRITGKFHHAGRMTTNPEGKRELVLMHRLLCQTGQMVDHKNKNPLDNRRCNLRACSNGQNQFNTGPKAGRRFKGISKSGNKWRASIRAGLKQPIYLGTFSDAETAARAYDSKAIELHGEFATLNFPTET